MMLEITGTPHAANQDGSLTILVSDETGQQHELLMPAVFVGGMIQAFQKAQIRRMASGGNFDPPQEELNILAAATAHNGPETEMMVSIAEIGWVVLRANDERLRHLRNVIDDILSSRSSRGPSGPN